MDMWQLMILSIILNTVSTLIATYIFYRIYRIYRLLKDRYLMLIVIGFLILALGSLASMLSSAYALSSEGSGGGEYLGYNYISNCSCHSIIYNNMHPMTSRHRHGLMHHPWIHGEKSYSWRIISFSSPLYPIAYLFILLGVLGEFIGEQGSREYYVVLSTGSVLVLGSDILSFIILLAIITLSITRKSFTFGCIGYFFFLASHLLRAVAVITGSPSVFLLGEMMRPMGLIAIAVGVSIHGRR